MQSLMSLFKKTPPKSAAKPCCCVVYDDLGCVSRNLFDEEFPTSSSVRASVGHTIRGVRLGVDSTIECKADGSVFATATPEIMPRCCRIAGTVESGRNKTRGKVIAGVSDLAFLPGFAGEVTVSNSGELCRLKTQVRHKCLSVVSDNAFKENHDLAVALNAVSCCPRLGVAAGVATAVDLKKIDFKQCPDYEFKSIDGRINFVHGPWSIFLESANFGKDYSLSVMRKMLVPHFTNEMIIAARLSAHAACPDLSAAKTLKDKAAAVNAALTPMGTLAVRTKLTDFSAAKIKVDSMGVVGFSFSEQLSQFAHAVFAVNVDATQLSKPNNHKFAFTLTLMH